MKRPVLLTFWILLALMAVLTILSTGNFCLTLLHTTLLPFNTQILVNKEPMIECHNYGRELLNISIELSVTVSVHLNCFCVASTRLLFEILFSVSILVFPQMYLHMFTQRQKVMAVSTGKKVKWYVMKIINNFGHSTTDFSGRVQMYTFLHNTSVLC